MLWVWKLYNQFLFQTSILCRDIHFCQPCGSCLKGVLKRSWANQLIDSWSPELHNMFTWMNVIIRFFYNMLTGVKRFSVLFIYTCLHTINHREFVKHSLKLSYLFPFFKVVLKYSLRYVRIICLNDNSYNSCKLRKKAGSSSTPTVTSASLYLGLPRPTAGSIGLKSQIVVGN